MKNWNITQLNFSNKEYKSLCSAYWKILILAAQIDGDVNEKEIDTLLSLIVRTPLRPENRDFFKKINHVDIETETVINRYKIKNNYLQVFELENLIFFEMERNIVDFIKILTDKDLISKTTEEKIDELKKHLQTIKTILENKTDIMWEDYIKAFYEWLYDYVEKITKMVWKWIFLSKIWKEEKQLLSTIKEILGIKWDLTNKAVSLNRHNHILFD